MRTSNVCLALVRNFMEALPCSKIKSGVVYSAGKMTKAVRVRVSKQVYNSYLRKPFTRHESYTVSDPNDSLRAGDVIKFGPAGAFRRNLENVVLEILAPWGPAIDERPPVLTEEERLKIVQDKQERKLERRLKRQEKETETEGTGKI